MQKLVQEKLLGFTSDVKKINEVKSTKFTIDDAIRIGEETATEEELLFINLYRFLKSNPLKNNQYYNYIVAYEKGYKLNENLFAYDLKRLHKEYAKIDKAKEYAEKNFKSYLSKYSVRKFEDYVVFMMLKLEGFYRPEYDSYFSVKKEKMLSREYNPLTNIPSILRAELPIEVMEFDISRAFPSFIDKQLGIKARKEDVYSLIDKETFNTLLNTHKGSKGANISDVRKQLKPIYKDRVNDVITEERFNTKGKLFKEFEILETEYINKFVNHNLEEAHIKFVRLHDGIFIKANTDTEEFVLDFEGIQFKIKECIKEQPTKEIQKPFYDFNSKGEVVTRPTAYADLFEAHNMLRITDEDNDEIVIFKDTNNVVKSYNWKTETVSFLINQITHHRVQEIKDKIAKDISGNIRQGYLLMQPRELKYYKDTADCFGLPFKNGFIYVDSEGNIKRKNYSDVEGFFHPNKRLQNFDFEYTDEVGEFERFISLAFTKKDVLKDYLEDEDKLVLHRVNTMIGYLSNSYKNPADSVAVILTDLGANGDDRRGGRGKSLIQKALYEVTNYEYGDGGLLKMDYNHTFGQVKPYIDLVIVEDAKKNFNWHSFYNLINSDWSVNSKGKEVKTIPFKLAPKLLFNTNYIFGFNSADTSTRRRFAEYKLTDFFNERCSPKTYFSKVDGKEVNFFDDWNVQEWNRFYSYIFRCLKSYMKDGILRIQYDKTEDHFRIKFGYKGEPKYDEFKRIWDEVVYLNKARGYFTTTDFLKVYRQGSYVYEKWFTDVKTKQYIEPWIKYHNIKGVYKNSRRQIVIPPDYDENYEKTDSDYDNDTVVIYDDQNSENIPF